MDVGMASNELGFRCVWSQHLQAEDALRSGGVKRRLFGAVLQLCVDNGARNGVKLARISMSSEPNLQAECALRSGGVKRRPSVAVLHLSVDNGARNGGE